MNADPTALRIRLLPALALERDGRTLELPKSRKTRALLAYLLLSERPVPRERLCELLWEIPDDPRAALRWSLSKLRPLTNVDGLERVCADRLMAWFEPHACCVDWMELRSAAAAGFEQVDARQLDAWANALTSGFLVDVDLPDQLDYQAWLTALRAEAGKLAGALSKARGEQVQHAVDALARPAVAVLPFTNRSADPEDEYFADGLTEDLITALSSWKSFPVIARN